MYEELMNIYEKIPESLEIEPTSFELAGFPHYENVISNILAFFFDSSKQHSFGNLFVESLINSLPESTRKEYNNLDLNFEVEREEKTTTGHYIDLLLHNDSCSIVIENKIFAGLQNELDDYYTYAKTSSVEASKKVFGLVLSLEPVTPTSSNFYNITYAEFIHTIRANMGFYLSDNNLKYLPLLINLIVTIENLAKGKYIMNTEFVAFVNKNSDSVERFGEDLKALHDGLRKIVQKVNATVVESVKDNSLNQSPYRELPRIEDIAVSDFTIKKDDSLLSIDARLNSRNWSFEIWARNKSTFSEDLKDYCEKRGLKGSIVNIKNTIRFVLEEHPSLDTKPEDIGTYIAKIIDLLIV